MLWHVWIKFRWETLVPQYTRPLPYALLPDFVPRMLKEYNIDVNSAKSNPKRCILYMYISSKRWFCLKGYGMLRWHLLQYSIHWSLNVPNVTISLNPIHRHMGHAASPFLTDDYHFSITIWRYPTFSDKPISVIHWQHSNFWCLNYI